MEKQIIFEGNLEQFCVGCSNYDNCIRTNFDLIQCNYAEENYKEIENEFSSIASENNSKKVLCYSEVNPSSIS